MLLARRCVNPPKVNQAKDLPGAIDRWEEDVRRIQNVYKEPLGEGLKRAILVEMLPSTLIEGVMARLKQDDTYDSVKDMVLDYVSTRVDFCGAQPMDCSNFKDYDDTSTPDEPSWMELNWVNKGEARGKSKGKGTARAKVRLDHGTTPGRARTRPTAWSTMRTTMSSGTVRRRQRSSTCASWTRTHPRQESP